MTAPPDLPVFPSWKAALLALGCVLSLVALLAVRSIRHRTRLRRIPIRVHVAGARGKSSVVRLIAAGLRGDGRRVLAKTTGTNPTSIEVDGKEVPWHRIGAASVHEQRSFVRKAARVKAHAIVVESMAIKEEYLWASEHLLVRATHVVVTNVRPDHQEVFGDDTEAMLRATDQIVPVDGRIWITDEVPDALAERAASFGNEVTRVSTGEMSPNEVNLRLAISVCEALGVPVAMARARMSELPPTDSDFSLTTITTRSGTTCFANAFACNDVTSLDLLLRDVHPRGATDQDVIFLNARADRPLRTRIFLDYLHRHHPRARVFVSHPRFVPTLALRRAARGSSLRIMNTSDPQVVMRELLEAVGAGGYVWGIGNHRGLGERLVRMLHEETPCSPPR